MVSSGELRAAVVGTGFIGAVHVDALRRLGIAVAGVVGSSRERAERLATSAQLRVFASFEELLDDGAVDVVHLATPNHLHHLQAKQALAAGKHVVCEKPLATRSEDSAELLELAETSGLVHAVNFNLRFYAQCHQARALVRGGEAGETWNVHGGYLQDWLLRPADWNWRLDPALGGELRAVADIGSHWLDLVQFVTGLEIVEVLADLATTIPVRQRPAGPIQTFATSATGAYDDVPVASDDLGNVLLRFRGGARGSVVLSQVSAGRKNSLRFEVDGSEGAVAWDSERPEELRLGRRDEANTVLLRNPSLLAPSAAARTTLPAGHSEGFAETLRELFRSVYAGVAAGGPPPEPDYPTFRDGHAANVLGDAIARSSREGRWVEVPGG